MLRQWAGLVLRAAGFETSSSAQAVEGCSNALRTFSSMMASTSTCGRDVHLPGRGALSTWLCGPAIWGSESSDGRQWGRNGIDAQVGLVGHRGLATKEGTTRRVARLMGHGHKEFIRAEGHRREREKQARVNALIAKAREGVPPPMDLARGDVDGSPEFERTGAITEAYEPRPVDAFAVVFLMGHQYKVTVDDLVFVDRMDGVEVNDELSLNRVMLIGTHAETVIGRPIVPGAIVKAVVEEHFLDQKRITFKFKRRKNYKRYLGSRHAMTTLRITAIESDLVDIQPTQVPETETTGGGSAAQKRQGSVGGRVQE